MIGYKIYDKEKRVWKQGQGSFWVSEVEKAKIYRTIGQARSAIVTFDDEDKHNVEYWMKYEFVEFEMLEKRRLGYFDSFSKKDLLRKISRNEFTPVQIAKLRQSGCLKRLEDHE